MKKLLSYSAVCASVALLFASCSNLSITKRHYNSGYYIDYGKGTQSVSVPVKDDKTSNTVAQLPVSPEPKTAANVVASQPNAPATVAGNTVKQAQKATAPKVVVQKSAMSKIEHKQASFEHIIAPDKTVLNESPTNVRDDDGGRALSLLWLVIVVILIVWLIGILAGGFGLGGLINLLLLIALILLILWLLRIA